MRYIFNKKTIIRIALAAWVILWVSLIIKEDKDGQYGTLSFLYSHGREENVRHVYGERLYGFIGFCLKNVPPEATCGLRRFGNLSVDEVRARYSLWPLKCVKEGGEYLLVYEDNGETVEGYSEFMRYDDKGLILKKEGAI